MFLMIVLFGCIFVKVECDNGKKDVGKPYSKHRRPVRINRKCSGDALKKDV